MKRLALILSAIIFAVTAFAQKPVIPSNVWTIPQPLLTGGQHVIAYYSGQDTVGPVARIAITGHDTLKSTGWIQIASKMASPATSQLWPRTPSLSDSLATLDADKIWFWAALDTTSLWSGTRIGYKDSLGANVDSLGLQQIEARFALLPSDTTAGGATWADTTQKVMVSGSYNSQFYGTWQYEVLSAYPRAIWLNLWLIRNARVPACVWVKFTFRSWDTLADFVVVKWRVVITN